MSGYAHPGSMQTRLGAVLNMIETNIEQTDTVGVSNFIRLLETYARPILRAEKDLERDLARLRPLDPELDPKAFEVEMRRLEILLEAFHRRNIFGYSTPEMGEAKGLAPEPEKGEEVLVEVE